MVTAVAIKQNDLTQLSDSITKLKRELLLSKDELPKETYEALHRHACEMCMIVNGEIAMRK